MNLSAKISKLLLKRNLVTFILISISIAAFAALGDGGKKDHSDNLALSPAFNVRSFSLHSGYNYKANNLFNRPDTRHFIMLNTVVTYQRGNATYVLPVRKKVLLDKIKINPLPSRY